MSDCKLDLLQGTLDLMVLQTHSTLGALHDYGIARRIEQDCFPESQFPNFESFPKKVRT